MTLRPYQAHLLAIMNIKLNNIVDDGSSVKALWNNDGVKLYPPIYRLITLWDSTTSPSYLDIGDWTESVAMKEQK